MKKTKKRENIKKAANKLFVENGVEKTSVSEIAKSANIAKGTFYIYYPCKDDLIDDVFSEVGMDFIRGIFAQIEKGGDISTNNAVDYIVDKAIDRFVENREFLKIMKNDISNKNEYEYKKIFIEEFKRRFEKIVKLSPSEENVNMNVLIYIVVDMFIGTCYNAIILNSPYTIEEARINLKGILHKILK